jgi:hypothetical protein
MTAKEILNEAKAKLQEIGCKDYILLCEDPIPNTNGVDIIIVAQATLRLELAAINTISGQRFQQMEKQKPQPKDGWEDDGVHNKNGYM